MFDSKNISVTPAYGRDYKNKAQAQKDWDDDKDFVETSSRRYINKAYADGHGYSVVIVYGNHSKYLSV
jgi:hypothetical protein